MASPPPRCGQPFYAGFKPRQRDHRHEITGRRTLFSIINSEQDLAEQIIYSDPTGNIIRLKDVARIVREYPDPESYITNNGHKCLLISMEMLQGNNIVQYGKEVDEVLRQFHSELPEGVNIERIADQPKVVDHSISNFLLEMGYAIIAVILVP